MPPWLMPTSTMLLMSPGRVSSQLACMNSSTNAMRKLIPCPLRNLKIFNGPSLPLPCAGPSSRRMPPTAYEPRRSKGARRHPPLLVYMCVELPHANQAAHLSHALSLRARGASCTPSISKMGCRGKALGTLHTIFIHEVPNGMRGSGSVVPRHDAPGGMRTTAKGVACRYQYIYIRRRT